MRFEWGGPYRNAIALSLVGRNQFVKKGMVLVCRFRD